METGSLYEKLNTQYVSQLSCLIFVEPPNLIAIRPRELPLLGFERLLVLNP